MTTADTITIDKPSGETTASYQFSVSNTDAEKTAEVSLSYVIKVVLPKALPAGVSVRLRRNGSATTAAVNGTTYTFTGGSFTFPAGVNTTHTYTLNFTGGDNLTTSATLTGITVSVIAEQID